MSAPSAAIGQRMRLERHSPHYAIRTASSDRQFQEGH